MIDYNIVSKRLRYIVPFEFDSKKSFINQN